MDTQVGVSVSLLKTIKVDIAGNAHGVSSQGYKSTSASSPQGMHNGLNGASSEDCCCIWDEIVRMNKEMHLGNCLESVTTGLLHRLKNNSLTNQEKSSIINFLCDSGALQTHITTSVFTENDSGRKRESKNRTVGRVEKQSGVGMALSSQSSDEMSGEREMSTRRNDEEFPEEEMSTTTDNEPDVRVKLEKHEWIVEDGNYVVQKEVCDSEHFQSIAESTSRQHLSLQATDYNPGYTNRKPIMQTESRLQPHRQTSKSHRDQGLMNSRNAHQMAFSDQPTQGQVIDDGVPVIFTDEIKCSDVDETRDLFQPQQPQVCRDGENSTFYEAEETNAFSLPDKRQDYIASVRTDTAPSIQTDAISLPVSSEYDGIDMNSGITAISSPVSVDCMAGNSFAGSTAIINLSSPSFLSGQNQDCRFCGSQSRCITELRNRLSGHFQSHYSTSGGQDKAPVLPEGGKDDNCRPYECKYCRQRFKHSWDFKKHITTHAGKKPFKCGLCSKRFSRRDACKNHMRIHNSEMS